MNFLDLLPDDIIELINKNLMEAHNNERRKERKKRNRIQKERKRISKQYKYSEKLLEKAYPSRKDWIKKHASQIMAQSRNPDDVKPDSEYGGFKKVQGRVYFISPRLARH
jgi:hypothetical protein